MPGSVLQKTDAFQRGLFAAITTIAIVGFGLTLMIPLLSLEMERRGVPGFMIGAQTAVMAIMSVIGSLIAPRFIQRYGVQRIIVAAICINALIFPFYPHVDNIYWWFPMRAVSGFCFSIMFITSEFWITSIAPEQKRGLVMGIYATCLSIGFALGPAVPTLVGTRGALPFYIGTAIILAALLPQLVRAPALPQIIKDSHRPAFFTIFRAAPIAILAAFFFAACESTNFSFLAIWGVRIGAPETQAALMLTMIGIGNVILQIPIGLLADKMNRALLLLIIAAFSAFSLCLAPFLTTTPALLYALLLVWGGTVAGMYTVGLAYLSEKFSGASLASANAAFVTAYALGMFVVPPLAGKAMDIWNPHGYIAVIVLSLLVYCLIAMAYLLRPANGANPKLS